MLNSKHLSWKAWIFKTWPKFSGFFFNEQIGPNSPNKISKVKAWIDLPLFEVFAQPYRAWPREGPCSTSHVLVKTPCSNSMWGPCFPQFGATDKPYPGWPKFWACMKCHTSWAVISATHSTCGEKQPAKLPGAPSLLHPGSPVTHQTSPLALGTCLALALDEAPRAGTCFWLQKSCLGNKKHHLPTDLSTKSSVWFQILRITTFLCPHLLRGCGEHC